MGTVGINFNNRNSRESIVGLSLVVYPNEIIYGAWNKENTLIRAEIADRSENLLSQITAISKDNRDPEIKISLATLPFLHIPSKIYSAKKASSFFEDIYPKRLLNDQFFNNDELADSKINTSYYIPKDLGKRLGNKSKHFSTVLAKSFLDDEKLIAFVNKETLILCLIRNGVLHFYNQYTCHHPEDYLYYILLAYDQFDMNTKESDLSLSGRISEVSNISKLLKQYLNIKYLKFNEAHFRTEELPQHFYHDLYLSWLCA